MSKSTIESIVDEDHPFAGQAFVRYELRGGGFVDYRMRFRPDSSAFVHEFVASPGADADEVGEIQEWLLCSAKRVFDRVVAEFLERDARPTAGNRYEGKRNGL